MRQRDPAAGEAHQVTALSRTASSRGHGMLVPWRYHELIRNLVLKDLRVRYRGSFAGLMWALLKPLSQIAVLGFAFSVVLRIDIPNYLLFLVCGILHWNLFSASMFGTTMSVIDGANLVKKVYFPRLVLPVSAALFAFLEFGFTVLVFFSLYYFLGGPIWMGLLLYPIVLFLQMTLIIGIGLGLSALTVYFRDLRELVDVGLNIGFWLTPILYDLAFVPQPVRSWLFLNPMVSFVNAYHHLLFSGTWPSRVDWQWMIFWSLSTFLLGTLVFQRLSKRFAEEL